MPIYEYKCVECAHIQELIRNPEARNAPTICEKCESISKRVEISHSNFHLKGQGWHDPKGGVR